MAEVLVVGAGLAGVAAAVELARAGWPVLVVDRAARAGGAVHCQPLPGRPVVASHARRWDRLWAEAQALPIRWSFGTRFSGLDHGGCALLAGACNRLMRPLAVVLATGARERVRPRPGWTLPGVTTAGAAQIALKTLGEPPAGRVVLAGSGPLLLALGAQMVRLGNAPVAIVEAGRPFARPWRALGLPPGYLAEAARHMATLLAARVPVLTGAEVADIRDGDAGLTVTLHRGGQTQRIAADRLCLHDGIRPNDQGLTDCPALPVLRLGDCAEALGGRAALASGRAGGQALARALRTGAAPGAVTSPALLRERRAQARLARIYAHAEPPVTALPGDTILCRCEGRTLDDLRALGPAPRLRDLRLIGRFGMGACQGRFCGDAVARALDSDSTAPLGPPRWPVAPIPVADLLAAEIDPMPPPAS